MEMQLFNNPTFGQIRTAGTADNPQFCLADLCRALGLNVNGVRQRLGDGVISTYPIPDSLGREQFTNFVNEDGLYDVILDSRKPEARAFRKWITSEVIPAIRRTGGYIPVTEQDTDEEIMAKALLISKRTLEQQKQRIQMLEGENQFLTEENKLLAPKAQYTDDVLQSRETYTFEQMSKELGFRGVQQFTKTLVAKKICFKRSGTYMLYAQYADQKLTGSRTSRFFHRDGTPGSNTYTVWTEKGRMWLHKLFNVAMKPIDLSMFDFDTDL